MNRYYVSSFGLILLLCPIVLLGDASTWSILTGVALLIAAVICFFIGSNPGKMPVPLIQRRYSWAWKLFQFAVFFVVTGFLIQANITPNGYIPPTIGILAAAAATLLLSWIVRLSSLTKSYLRLFSRQKRPDNRIATR